MLAYQSLNYYIYKIGRHADAARRSTSRALTKHMPARHGAAMHGVAMLAAGALLAIALPMASHAQEGLRPGEAFLTKFSGTTTVAGAGGARTVIDQAGTVGTALDLTAPGFTPDGRHWLDEPHLFSVTAGDVGQVFGVTLDDASPPNIYLTATSAFGLHRSADSSGWMDGMWGPGGGPGTVYRLTAANHYLPEIFAEITLDGRPNSGAALGNIAFDRQHHQLFVSDLETGMIHRVALADGADLGRYDHGMTGRANFVDALTGASLSLTPIAFDSTSAARTGDCPSGDFARTPSCWNYADFRRRVWGLDVRPDSAGEAERLYYAVWGSQGFGSPDWPTAGDDQQNSVWSVAIADDGGFDTTSVRREFFLPEFFRSPAEIARAGISNPVTDIAFPRFGAQDVMLVAERGGVRNLGLSAENAFAYPHEARVLRYERAADGAWQAAGRYDVGFYDRRNEGPPYVRAGSAGGAAFGMGYDASGRVDPARTDAFVWMTGDNLCAPDGPCFDPATGTDSDTAQVTGLQGQDGTAFGEVIPDAAFRPYPAPGPAEPPTGPEQSYMVDADVNVDASGMPIAEELDRNDATRVGDVVVFQQAAAKPDLQIVKRALDRACTAGRICSFEITITNVGDVPYSGPLTVRDTPAEGAELTVPPSAWTCTPVFGDTTECSHAPVDLAPGAEASFQVAVRIPTWWNRPVYDNCVELVTPGAGEDARTYNNQACGYAPTADPGTPYYAPDLKLTKFGIGQCDWFGECRFVVRVTNVGAVSYTGQLSIHDHVPYAGATLAGWAPSPEWMCAPAGGTDFTCGHPPVTLLPGEYREVLLRLAAPPPTPGHARVRNCSWIDWGGAPRDYNPGNEYDCAVISRFPPGDPGARPMLQVEKKPTTATCRDGAGPGGGWACDFDVLVTNIGGAPYFGPIAVSDVPTGPLATLVHMVPVPWACTPGVGIPGPRTCTHPGIPGGLQPGQHATLPLDFEVPAAVPVGSELENCATVASDYNGDGIAEDHTSCAKKLFCHPGAGDCPKDLALSKSGPMMMGPAADICYPGFPCPFLVRIENLSDQPYHGPVDVTDMPDPGVGPLTLGGLPGFVCVPAGANYTCSYPGDILPGNFLFLDMSFMIPAGYPGPSFTNCAEVPPDPVENTEPGNDKGCYTAFAPAPDLWPFGGTECKRGADCTLDLGIKNGGLLPFIGSAGVRGTLSPAVPVVSITPQTPGLTCSVTGQGTYECRGQSLNIPPGESVKWQAVIHIAEDFPADTITHTKDMIWPDRRVKDKKPENDRNTSIITILGPKEPPPPQPAQATAYDLKVEKRGEADCRVGRPCRFTVVVTNVGEDTFVGPLVIDDRGLASARLTSHGPSPWTCHGSGGHYTCTYPSATLAPGASITLTLALTTNDYTDTDIDNCASLLWTDESRVRAVQQRLNDLGFAAGKPDGKLGPQTRKAIQAYQARAGLAVTGRLDDQLLNQLFVSWGTGDSNAKNDRSCAAVHLQPSFESMSCTGGRIVNSECICPRGTEVQQTGTHAYRCVPTITCEGGKADNNRCYCPRGLVAEQIGTNAYRCVKPQPRITCRGGAVRNNQCICPRGQVVATDRPQRLSLRQAATDDHLPRRPGAQQRCVCPRGTEVQRTGTYAFACVPTQPSITCTGGRVSNNECICPRGTEVQQTATHAYRCVKPQPSLVCNGGTISRGQCFCPKGTERQQTGPFMYQCVAAQPQLRCSGGTVQNNECICPRGMEARRVSNTFYRCVKSQATTPSIETPSPTGPSITCSGGLVRNGQCYCPKGTVRQQTATNAYRCAPAALQQLQRLVPQLRVTPQMQQLQ